MQIKLSNNLKKIMSQFEKLGNLPKKIIKYGTQVSLALLTAGTALYLMNIGYYVSDYYELISKSVIKISFTLLAEAIIGGLIMDYLFR